MNTYKKRMNCLFLGLLLMIITSSVIGVSAGTKLSFNLKGLQSSKTSTVTTGTNKFKYLVHWNNVSIDNIPLDSYYLNVKLQQRNIGFVYVTKSNINFRGPVSGSEVVSDFGTQLQNMTVRYVLENYGALVMSGYIESNSYN